MCYSVVRVQVSASPPAREECNFSSPVYCCPVYALAHGYGPADDFARRMKVAWNASPHGVWLNRYGYLSDEKLKIIGETTNS